MSMSTKLELRSRIRCNGSELTVVGLGQVLQLRNQDGDLILMRADDVLNALDYKLLGRDAEVEAAEQITLFEQATKNEQRRATRILGHLFDVFPELLLDGDNHDVELVVSRKADVRYDPTLTDTKARIEAKQRQTHWSRRTIYNYRERYLRWGLAGLVDRRRNSGLKEPSLLEPRVLDELHMLINEHAGKSRITTTLLHERLCERIATRNASSAECEEPLVAPSLSTFRRKFELIKEELGWDGPTKYRKKPNKNVRRLRRFRALRHGQYVLIDSSPWDVLAWDPVSGRFVALELTIALDLYTRSIVGFRFTPRTTKGVDAALLLFDIVAPKQMVYDAPAGAWSYLGVPENLVIEPPRKDSRRLAGVPIVAPDSVVVDRNKIFLSQTFQDGCRKLGISIILARPRRPTDKAQIERAFGKIATSFLERLPGYKGSSVHDRGRRIEFDASITVDAMRVLFARWIAEIYQYDKNDGLTLPGNPEEDISPNRMYEASLLQWGFIRVPLTRTLYFELLPTHLAQVHANGVQRQYLFYDDDALNDFRPDGSGRSRTKRAFKYDPRDLSKIYFQHPEHKSWHAIRWVDREDNDQPFNDLRLAYAIELTKRQGWQLKDRRQLAANLNSLITETLAGATSADAEIIDIKERAQHDQLRRDQELWVPEIDDVDGLDATMEFPDSETDEAYNDWGAMEDELDDAA
jgi:transposase InsO family protein